MYVFFKHANSVEKPQGGRNSLTFMTGVIMYIFGVWNLGKTNISGDWKKYLGSKIDNKLTYLGSKFGDKLPVTYLGSEILRAKSN